jgi:hypothetical protein
MALVLLNAGREPLGQFDALDSQLTGFLGGEVVTWGSVATPGSDLASADVFEDGYVGTTNKTRPVIQRASTSSSAPLFLSDDGVAHYGTLFGTIVGGTAGQVISGGAVLGPSTATGSGKITCWDKQGLYGVTLDAVDTAATGLVPSNASLAVGTHLTYTSSGLLTPVGSANAVSGAPVVGYLSEFSTNGSLVTTPQSLTNALNSPSGDVSSLVQETFYMAVFSFVGV